MQRIHEAEPVLRVLEVADKRVSTEMLAPGYEGIVVETGSGDLLSVEKAFEGTVIYFPGVTAAELVKG